MHQGKLVFAQVMAHLPLSTFRRCVARYGTADGSARPGTLHVAQRFAKRQLREGHRVELVQAREARDLVLAVPPGISLAGGAQHAGQRQCGAAVANLCRPGPAPDRHRPAGVCARAHWSGLEGDGLCLRRHDDRPVPVSLSVGAVSVHQGRRQAAHAAGARWNKDAWKRPIKEAAKVAKLSRATTAYTLRHSVITDLVVGGLDLMTVAKLSGTSVVMIEKHYGHLRAEHARKALATLEL
jgi:hypothetical protein